MLYHRLDISDFHSPDMTAGKFFLIAESDDGMVDSMSVMDYTSSVVHEIKCKQTKVPISGTTYLTVTRSATPISSAIPQESSSYNVTFHKSRIYFKVPETSKKGTMQITLYNLQGKLIKTFVTGKVTEYSVAAPKLAMGSYLCKMKLGNYTKIIHVLITE